MRTIFSKIEPPRFFFMGLLALLTGAYIYLMISFLSSVDNYPDLTHPQAITPTQPSKYNIDKVSKIFGAPPTEDVKKVKIKESALSLKLVASYATGEKGQSAAVLQQDGGKQTLFYPGDLIIPGVQLIKVEARRILIQRDHIIEQVSIADLSTNSTQQLSIVDSKPVAGPTHEELTSIVQGGEQLDAMLNILRASSTSNAENQGIAGSTPKIGIAP